MSHLLSQNLLSGCIGLIFAFVFCFFAVHAPIIFKKIRKKPTVMPPAEPPKKETEQEPVYYIVEKKRRRIREQYSDPKQIKFK